MNLHICKGLELPLDIVTARIAIYGTSGSGKTAFGRLLAEKIHDAGHRFCAIDLKNDWWGLKSSADGSTAGIPIVIFGGPRKDVELFADAGAVVADTVCSIEQSCVVDLDALSKGKQLKFLTAFMERLYDVNRDPLMLLADEADRYAPQKAMSEEANISLGAAEDICRRGRKRGIGSMWLTQRTAVLNKNVSDICDLTVVFRTPGSRDLKELEDRVARIADKAQTTAVMKLAPGLADGQAIFLSSHPKLRDFLPKDAQPIQLTLPRTFDSSATPGVGKRRAEPKVLAKTDLAKIEQKMAEQVQRAKAEDPAELRRELARVKQENAKLQQTAASVKPAENRVEVFVLKDGQLAKAEKLVERFAELRTRHLMEADAMTNRMSNIFHEISTAVSQTQKPVMQNHLHKPAARPSRPLSAPLRPPAGAIEHDGDFRPNETQQRILDALMWWRSIGQDSPSTLQVGAIALVDPTGGYFGNLVGPLATQGWVVRSQGRMSILEAGLPQARVPEKIATMADYHEMLRGRVRRSKSASGKTVEILDAVIRRNGASIRAEEIGAEVGIDHTGGYFGNTIGPLGTIGLIKRERGTVTPTEILFPPGLS